MKDLEKINKEKVHKDEENKNFDAYMKRELQALINKGKGIHTKVKSSLNLGSVIGSGPGLPKPKNISFIN